MATRYEEPKRTPVERLGLTAVARSLGNAVARVRRLVPDLRLRHAPAQGRATTLDGFEATRRRLRDEISGLEGELERLHSLITSSAVVSNSGTGGERPTVDSLLAQSRRLRDRLHDKRYRLARVERAIARERRLAAVGPNAPASDEEPIRARRAREAPSRAARAESRDDPRVRTVFRTVEKALFDNRTAKLEFKRLAERLVDASPNVRREAVNRLGELDHPAAFDLLLVAVGDPNERVRLAALNGLGGMSRAAPADLFRSFLHDRNGSLRLAALRGLANMGSGALAVTEMTAAIEDEDPAVRKAAATVLGWHRVKGKSMALVFPALALALRDEEEGVRIAAAEALGSLCDARAVLPLIRALTDSSPTVQKEAERALRNTAGEEVDLIGQGSSSEERAAALKAWWAEARVHVVVGRAGPSDESDPAFDPAPSSGASAGADEAPSFDGEASEDFERLSASEPEDTEDAAPAPAAPRAEPAAAAPAEPAPTPRAEPAATPHVEPAPAPKPASADSPASAEPDREAAAAGFEALFPEGEASPGDADGGESAGEDYEDPFAAGDGS